MRRHPKATTKIVNGGTLLLAFSRELSQAWTDFTNGTYQTNPQQGAANLILRATGFNTNTGQIDQANLQGSIFTKFGAFALNKTAKWFLRRMKM
jgi:hypothetical protein